MQLKKLNNDVIFRGLRYLVLTSIKNRLVVGLMHFTL